MSIEKIIECLESAAHLFDSMSSSVHANAIRAAIEKLKTHPDNQPNEPLTVGVDVIRALVVAANSLRYNPEIDPDKAAAYERVLVGFRDDLCQEQPNEPQGDGWISVKNPPDMGGGRYLVWTDNSGPEICRWSEARKRWIGGAWTQHITHWRPMPKPPKESA